jgi:hypothetical protein
LQINSNDTTTTRTQAEDGKPSRRNFQKAPAKGGDKFDHGKKKKKAESWKSEPHRQRRQGRGELCKKN